MDFLKKDNIIYLTGNSHKKSEIESVKHTIDEIETKISGKEQELSDNRKSLIAIIIWGFLSTFLGLGIAGLMAVGTLPFSFIDIVTVLSSFIVKIVCDASADVLRYDMSKLRNNIQSLNEINDFEKAKLESLTTDGLCKEIADDSTKKILADFSDKKLFYYERYKNKKLTSYLRSKGFNAEQINMFLELLIAEFEDKCQKPLQEEKDSKRMVK